MCVEVVFLTISSGCISLNICDSIISSGCISLNICGSIIPRGKLFNKNINLLYYRNLM